MTDLEATLAGGIRDGLTPGAVAAVSVDGQVRELASAGCADLRTSAPMTAETLFDIASLTKVVATTTALMNLVGRRALQPDDPLERFLPFPNPAIALADLLTHRSGLLPWQPLYFGASDTAATLELIRRLPPAGPIGSARRYSDLGFILLGAVVGAVTGTDLAAAVRDLVTDPLGLSHTGFRPSGQAGTAGSNATGSSAGKPSAGESIAAEPIAAEPTVVKSIAATSPGDVIEQRMTRTGEPHPVILPQAGFDHWRTQVLRGEVADCNAFHALGGVAGHAGLFSTIGDLLALAHGLLGVRDFPAPRATVESFLRPGPDEQALGWWTRDLPGGIAYCHSGFTGTRLLVQPATGTAMVLLTNRLHMLVPAGGQLPDGGDVPPDVTPLWTATLRAAGLV